MVTKDDKKSIKKNLTSVLFWKLYVSEMLRCATSREVVIKKDVSPK